MAHATRLAPFLLLAALAVASATDSAAQLATPAAPAPDEARAEAPPMPPPAPGRRVVLDSRLEVSTSERQRTLKLSDIDPETARLVREINSKPGSWQLLLLSTSQDLPERMFHPGFAIRLKPRALPAVPAVETEQAAPAAEEPPAGKGSKAP